jgi:hypothetical protein
MKIKKIKFLTYLYILIHLMNYVLIQKSKTQYRRKDINKSYKICVLMWYDDNIKDYADKCYEINKKYCEMHGFDIIKSDKRYYKNRKPQYERIPLIYDNLEKYDYVIWIDADAYFYLDSPDISILIEKYSNYNFILSGDQFDYNFINQSINRKETSIINSGVIIVKNSEYSKKVIQHWMTSDELLQRRHGFNDQGIIRLYRSENINNFQKNSIVLQYGLIQRFSRIKYYFYRLLFLKLLFYKPYIMHYAGDTNKTRVKAINNYYSHQVL